MKRTISSGLLTILFFSCLAQNDSTGSTVKNSYRYYNQFLAGVFISGDHSASVAAAMIHGMAGRNFRAGLGLSYDVMQVWRINSILAAISYDIAGDDDNTLFFQGSGGPITFKRIDNLTGVRFESRKGYFLQPSLGYRIATEKWSIYIMGGYRHQKMKWRQSYRWWPEQGRTTIRQTSERVVIQIGFGWH